MELQFSSSADPTDNGVPRTGCSNTELVIWQLPLRMALAIFDESLVELPCDVSYDASKCATSAELLREFLKRHPNAASVQLGAQAVLGYSHDGDDSFHRTQLAASGDIFCIFTGRIDNVAQLRRSYGVAGGHGHDTSESQLVLGMYKALRSALLYDQVSHSAESALAEMVGPFSTVIYDNETGNAFIAAVSSSEAPLNSSQFTRFLRNPRWGKWSGRFPR
ncbi:unnamed protein product [Closterium sp. Yama58-4]|nr:unnamed protein product [Closterium sp. Yama58-4]